MWLKDENIRLFGIDAPESRTSDTVEKYFGMMTKREVERLLPLGSTHTLVCHEYKGKFGRVLGTILVDGDYSLNDFLVDNRLAVVYNGSLNRKELEPFHEANREYLRENRKIMARIKLETLMSIGSEIQQMVDETGIDYMDAALEYCRKHDMEVETLGDILKKHQNIRDAIRREAEATNSIIKEETSELEFE